MQLLSAQNAALHRPRSSRQHLFHFVRKVTKPFRTYRHWQASRQALSRRCEILTQLGKVHLPTRLNESAFVDLAGGRVQVLIRRPHARSGRFEFSLPRRSKPDVDAYLLVCLHPETCVGYALWMPVQNGSNYVAFTLTQARQQATKILWR